MMYANENYANSYANRSSNILANIHHENAGMDSMQEAIMAQPDDVDDHSI